MDPPAGYPQAAWLQGLDRESLSLRAVEGKGGLSLREALLQEAIVAASEITKHMEDGSSTARGGPWCQRELFRRDMAEIKAVYEADSKQAVLDYAAAHPEGSLSYHLQQKSWSGKASVQQPAPLFASPHGFFQVRRQSGRYKPGARVGKPGVSGHHKAGVKRPSGKSTKSGSQSSGAVRRFNKLPLVPMRRRRRPRGGT